MKIQALSLSLALSRALSISFSLSVIISFSLELFLSLSLSLSISLFSSLLLSLSPLSHLHTRASPTNSPAAAFAGETCEVFSPSPPLPLSRFAGKTSPAKFQAHETRG